MKKISSSSFFYLSKTKSTVQEIHNNFDKHIYVQNTGLCKEE